MSRLALRVGRGAWSAVLPVLLVGGYQLAATRAANLYFPPLQDVATAFRQTWLGPGLAEDVAPSLVNLALGYLVGVVAGLAAGIVLGTVPSAFSALEPLLAFLLTLPPVALLPAFVSALGVGRTMQVGVIAFGVFFVVAVPCAHALRSVDPLLRDVAAGYRIRGRRLLTHVLLPAVSPQLLGALRVALSLAVLVMVVSELVGASHGIGAATLLAQQSFAYGQMWAGMVLLAVLGILLNGLFTLTERPVLQRMGLRRADAAGPRTGGGPR